MNGRTVLSGLDVVLRDGLRLPGAGRIGLVCNSATVSRSFEGTPEALQRLGGLRLERIFSPQHGFAGEKQDNMVESGDGLHPQTGVPIISLYGRVREPEPEMLDGLDAIVIDLPDVGTRVYTFLATALLCLRACARARLPVVVLDRPNPIGGAIEGPVLEPEYSSFVGLIAVPLRHGLTAGEYCRFGAAALGLDLDLNVIPVEGWDRDGMQPETGLPWVPPSPNLPTLEGALVYPGMVLLEGTELSEGRGTTRPFEFWGAPWLDEQAVAEDAHRFGISGVHLRPVAFQPTFHKFAGRTVRGFQLHVTAPDRFRPVFTAVALLSAVLRRHRAKFAWRQPPYEYELTKLPIDLIAGSDALRLGLEAGVDPNEIAASWRPGEDRFKAERAPFLLYA